MDTHRFPAGTAYVCREAQETRKGPRASSAPAPAPPPRLLLLHPCSRDLQMRARAWIWTRAPAILVVFALRYTFKIPAQSTGWTSTFYIERIAITWLWLEGTCIQRLAAGYTGKPPLPGNGAPSMIAGAGAKLAQDKKDLEAAKPYWKIDGHGHSNGCFMHEREDILQDGKG